MHSPSEIYDVFILWVPIFILAQGNLTMGLDYTHVDIFQYPLDYLAH